MLAGIAAYLRRHHWGLIATFVALSGTAYAVDKVGSKDIAKDAVRSKHVKNDALKGKDINESKLGTVPGAQSADFATSAGDAATVAGISPSAFTVGRSSSTPNNCNPDSITFVDCASLTLNMPRSGRVLLIGAGRAYTAVGNCTFAVDGTRISAVLTQYQANSNVDASGLTYVTDPLPSGQHAFNIACNEVVAPFQFVEAQLSAVMIGDA